MHLETDRLQLRPYEMENLTVYHALMSDPDVLRYSSKEPCETLAQSEQRLMEIVRSGNDPVGFHALLEKESGRYIGEAGILSITPRANRCVIGYNLLPAFWGRGYATEIAGALVDYAFDVLKLERVEALTQEANLASRRVLEKTGFVLEGTLRRFAYIAGTYRDVCTYGMIRSDRQISKGADA